MSLSPAYYAAVLRRWGRPATWNGAAITVIFEVAYGEAGDGEYAVESRAYTADTRASAVPGAKRGDTLALDGRAYTVAAVQPDAADDWTRLVLERKA